MESENPYPSPEAEIARSARAPVRRPASGWWAVIGLLVPAFLLQMIILPCMCPMGDAKEKAALLADALILTRAVAGLMAEPESHAWIGWAALAFGTIPVILAGAQMAGGH